MTDIEKIEKEIEGVNFLIKPLESKRKKLYKKYKSLLENKSKLFIKTLPDNVKKYSKEQLEWLLYHWHDETSVEYSFRTKVLHEIPLFTCGINGGKYSDEIRQFQFLASKHYFKPFTQYYKLLKPVLKSFKSKFDDEQIVLMNMHISMLGFDTEYDGCMLEISLIRNKGRFIGQYQNYKPPTKWYTFKEIIEMFNVIEHDY